MWTLGIGTFLSLFAVHGRWDVALAAWLSGVFLLRFTRTHRLAPGLAGVWVASGFAAAFWLYESGLDPVGPHLLMCLALNAVLVVPFLVDRLATPRMAATAPLLASLVFPLTRVAAEFAIGTFSPTGTIWGSLAATQHDNLPLLQVAAVTGGYGVSFLVAWFAAVGNLVWERGVTGPQPRTVAVVFGIVLAVVHVGGSVRLAWFPPSATTVRVAGVSPTPATLKHRDTVMSNYDTPEQLAGADHTQLGPALAAVNNELLAVTEREARAGARIVAWPEHGAAVLATDKADLLGRVGALARSHRIYLHIGLAVVTAQAPFLENTAILVDPDGRVVWTYHKAHPVPGMESLTPGDGRVPTVDTRYGRLANLICFDADFPALARQGGSKRVDLMLVPSDDWWGFGTVHAEKATLRAIENGYSLLRQDLHGLAQVVDYQGRVIAASDYFRTDQQTVVGYVPTTGVRTVYATIGDTFAWLCLATLALLCAIAARRGAAADAD